MFIPKFRKAAFIISAAAILFAGILSVGKASAWRGGYGYYGRGYGYYGMPLGGYFYNPYTFGYGLGSYFYNPFWY